MSPGHHPSDETLLRQAAGGLAAAPALVLATHLEGCARCRARVAGFEAIGGAVLEALPPTPLRPDAFARAVARIDGEAPKEGALGGGPLGGGPLGGGAEPVPMPRPRAWPEGIALPLALRGCEIGRWWPLAPGIRYSRVTIPAAPAQMLMLLRVGTNKKLPAHGHSGTELTQILSGSFFDYRERYVAGDLMEADGEIDHQPTVSPDGPCLCLTAIEGRMHPHGVLARLVQRFTGL